MTEEKKDSVTSKNPTIFWVMQYSKKYTQIYEAVKEAFKDKYDVIIPDDSNDQISITEKVITQIINANFVVVDVSTIQYSTPEDATEKTRPLFNGNVMFELGIAMSYRKKVIMISSTDLNDLPFDFSSYLVNPYNFNNGAEFMKFIQKLENIIDTPHTRYKNPVADCDQAYDVVAKTSIEVPSPQTQQPSTSPTIQRTETAFDLAQLSKPALEILAACLRNGQLVYTNNQQFVFAGTSQTFVSELPEDQQQDTSLIVKTLVEKNLFVVAGIGWKVSELAQKKRQEILQADFELCVTTPKPLGFCDIVSSGLREGQNLVASPYVLHVPFCEIPRQYQLKIDNVELQPLLPAKACNQLFDYLEKRNIIHCEHSFEYDKEQMVTKRTGIVTAYGQRFSHRWREYVSPQTPYFEFLNQNTLPTESPINDVPQPDILDDIPEKVLEWLVEIHCSDDKQLQVVDVGNRYPEYTRFELYAGELSYKVCGNSALYRNNPDAFWQDLREAQDFFVTLKKYLVNTHRSHKYNSEAIVYELTTEGHVIAQIALNRLDSQRASKS